METWYWGESPPSTARRPNLLAAFDEMRSERLPTCPLGGQAPPRQGGSWLGAATRAMARA
jgi:hypothetical protein